MSRRRLSAAGLPDGCKIFPSSRAGAELGRGAEGTGTMHLSASHTCVLGAGLVPLARFACERRRHDEMGKASRFHCPGSCTLGLTPSAGMTVERLVTK